MVAKFKRQFGTGLEAWTYLGQNYLQVDRSLIPTSCSLLRDEEQFDYCVDITAVHYPKRERQFDMVWILYSLRSQRADPRKDADRRRRTHSPARFPSGRPPTGWSAKSSTCSASSSTVIRT